MKQLTFEGSVLLGDISSQGFSLVDHGIHPDEIDGLMEAYAKFTDNLPDPELETMNNMMVDVTNLDRLDYHQDNQVEWHKYRTNHTQFAKPGGYTNRSLQVAALHKFDRDVLPNGERIEDDPKEFYHFHPNSFRKIEKTHEQFDWGKIPPEVSTLHMRFSTIHRLAREAIINTLTIAEQTHPELTSKYARAQDLDNSPLRLLFYHPGQGDYLAAGHYDKSSFTMQIAESHMGLRAQNPQTHTMEAVRRPANKGVVFPGFLWTQMYPDSELSPAWHDVVNINELNDARSLHGRNCARWALIWFTNSEAFNLPQKTETSRVESILMDQGTIADQSLSKAS